MPEISRFLGIVITMFYNDHDPAHFHAKYGEDIAIISIESGAMLDGYLPPRVVGLVHEWREYHKSELMEDWLLARNHSVLKKIKPLE